MQIIAGLGPTKYNSIVPRITIIAYNKINAELLFDRLPGMRRLEELSILDLFPTSRPFNPFAQYEDKAHPYYQRTLELMRQVFTREVCGLAFEDFHRVPPTVVANDRVLEISNKSDGRDAIGRYYGSTDTVLLKGTYLGFESAEKTIVHELFHRLAGLSGSLFALNTPNRWMHEGFTELFAQTHVRALGTEPLVVSYAQEVLVAGYVRSVVGDDSVLLAAYRTADFSEVANRVNRVHGNHTFENWTACTKAEQVVAWIKIAVPVVFEMLAKIDPVISTILCPVGSLIQSLHLYNEKMQDFGLISLFPGLLDEQQNAMSE